MGIGMLVLYAALAVVGLWLTAELLLQSRAPLHWRALALGGFALVVAGMAVHSVPVIGAGAIGFATGQVLVTTAVKRGGKPAWSLRARNGELPGPLAKVPLLAAATSGPEAAAEEEAPRVGTVGPIEATEAAADRPAAPELDQLPVDDGDFGIYETTYPAPGQSPEQGYEQHQQPGYGYYEQQQQQQQQPFEQQQAGYGYYQPEPQYQGYEGYQGYDQQQWQPQPQAYEQPAYQPDYGGQPEYGIPGIPQQHSPEYYQQYQPDYQAQPQPQYQPQPEAPGNWQGWQ